MNLDLLTTFHYISFSALYMYQLTYENVVGRQPMIII